MYMHIVDNGRVAIQTMTQIIYALHLSILDNMRLIFFHFALVRAALPYCPFRRREVCCPVFR
jgi:hypothetical protein